MNTPESISTAKRSLFTSPNEGRGLKRKNSPSSNEAVAAPAKKVTPDRTENRYGFRYCIMKSYIDKVKDGNEYVLWERYHIPDRIPGMLHKIGVEKCDDLSDDDKKKLYRSLTREEVERHFNAIIVWWKMITKGEALVEEINNADPLFLMDSYTANCMIRVILERLYEGEDLLRKATEAVETNTFGSEYIIPGVARDAFETTFAAITASDFCDHWRLDSDEDLCKHVYGKVSELLTQLLWFHDKELGFIDEYGDSRNSLLNRIRFITEDWYDSTMTYLSRDNQNGKGRILDKDDTSVGYIKAYVSALGHRLPLRSNTIVQLAIKSSSSGKSCRVVVPGSLSLKKLGQLLAFLTGHADEYKYDANRGRSLKGSFFELHTDEYSGNCLRFGDSSVKKKAESVDKDCVGYAPDKSVKIVQVFQGLIVGANSGMVHESKASKDAFMMWWLNEISHYP